ncbi:MAG: rhomboid family intramembrane serine protease [Thermodesulfobacteriota bacterium]
MIPIRDINPSSTHPVINNAIIVVCVLVFLTQVTYSGGEEAFLRHYSLIPAEARLLTLFSYMFLHGGFWHLLSNMWFLYIFGDNIENRLGPARYLLFYIGCGLASGLAHLIFNAGSTIPTVGASGAIAGVMGAYLVLFPRAKILTLVPLLFIPMFFEIPAFFLLGLWFVMQLMNAATSSAGAGGVAWWAHVGGFVAGIAVMKLFGASAETSADRYRQVVSRKTTPRLQVIHPAVGGDDPHLYGQIVITPGEASGGTVKTVNIPWGFHSRLYRVNIPAGVSPGTVLRLPGLGKRTADGTAGDLYLKVMIR